MISLRKINPMVRSVAVIGAVMTMATGATFAALNSSATLTGNTIGTASANADLMIWDGDSFETSAPGFSFTDLTPGEKSEPYGVVFKNSGNVDLDLTARIMALPEFSEGITAEDVTLKFYGNCAEAPVSATLAQLNAAPVALPCDPLDADSVGVAGSRNNDANYWIKVKIADRVALDETAKTVGAFDIVFDGSSANTPEEPEVPEEEVPETEQAEPVSHARLNQ